MRSCKVHALKMLMSFFLTQAFSHSQEFCKFCVKYALSTQAVSFVSVLENYGMGWQRNSNWILTEDEDVSELGVMLEKEHANPDICAIDVCALCSPYITIHHYYLHRTAILIKHLELNCN